MTSLSRQRIAALIVTRGNSRDFSTVLEAVRGQSLPVDSLIIVDVAGTGNEPLGKAQLPEDATLIHVGRAANLGQAIRSAITSVEFPAEAAQARWWWILHDDSAPENSCLQHLFECGDQGRTIGAVGPKQLSWDGTQLLEVGIFATRSAQRLHRVTGHEIDQGQYDGTSDVLAVSTAGMLVDPRAWIALDGFDPALGPFGDGLDFGRRLHRAGFRVVVAPAARIRHRRTSLTPVDPLATSDDETLGASSSKNSDAEHDDSHQLNTAAHAEESLTDPPPHLGSEDKGRNAQREHSQRTSFDVSFTRRRYEQLYNWCKAVPLYALPFLALWLLIWTPIRAIGRVITGQSHLAGAELSAWGKLFLATWRLFIGRWKARRAAKIPASAMRTLEVSWREYSTERSEHRRRWRESKKNHREPWLESALRKYRTSAGVTCVAILAVTTLLSLIRWWGIWDAFTGGAWSSFPSEWGKLWEAAWASWVPGGDGYASPADPLLVVFSIISWPFHLIGVSPTAVATFMMVVAWPCAAASMWVMSRRFTYLVHWRAGAALLWAGLPALVVSQHQGRLAAVIFHVTLPLFVAAWMSVLRFQTPVYISGTDGPVAWAPPNRTGAIGAASFSGLVLVACAPWTLLVIVALFGMNLWRNGMRGWRIFLAVLTPIVVVAPTVGAALSSSGIWRALMTTGGGVGAYDIPAPWQSILGMPAQYGNQVTMWLAVVPGLLILLGAAIAVFTSMRNDTDTGLFRAVAPAILLGIGVIMLIAAVFMQRLHVALAGEIPTTAWSSPALSLGGIALIAACLVAIPTGITWDGDSMKKLARVAGVAAAVATVALSAAVAIRYENSASDAQLTAMEKLESDHVTRMSAPIIPAVSAQAEESSRAGRILVLRGTSELTKISAQLWRGNGPVMTDGSSVSRARELVEAAQIAQGGAADSARADLAQLALTLVAYPDSLTVAALAHHGIDTILSPVGDAAHENIAEALDRAPGLEKVGVTDAGMVWRLRPDGLQPARVRVVDSVGWSVVESTNLTTKTTIDPSSRGVLTLAERRSSSWVARVNGVELQAVNEGNWYQSFTLPNGGDVTIEHRTWWMYPWWIGAGLTCGASLLLSFPLRRKHP